MSVSGIHTAPSSGSVGSFVIVWRKLGLSQQELVSLLCGHELKSHVLFPVRPVQCPLATAVLVVSCDIAVSIFTVAAM